MKSSPYEISPRFRASPRRSDANNSPGMNVFTSSGKSARLLPSSLGEFDRVISAAARLASTIRKDSGSEESSSTKRTTPIGSARRSWGYKPRMVWLGSGKLEESSWISKPENLRAFMKTLSNELRLLGIPAKYGPRQT